MEEKTKRMTVREATDIAFSEMDIEFSILELTKRVRNLTERPALMDGTITRAVRKLRENGDINYSIVDQHKAIYQKLRSELQTKASKQLDMFQ